ncbi:MAG: hypothetical protein QXS41_01305 [Candidatus Woesearchaeota archaeon]
MENKPLFIQISEYQKIKELLKILEEKYNHSKELLSEIEKLHQEEEKEIAAWKASFQEMNEKLDLINRLFE